MFLHGQECHIEWLEPSNSAIPSDRFSLSPPSHPHRDTLAHLEWPIVVSALVSTPHNDTRQSDNRLDTGSDSRNEAISGFWPYRSDNPYYLECREGRGWQGVGGPMKPGARHSTRPPPRKFLIFKTTNTLGFDDTRHHQSTTPLELACINGHTTGMSANPTPPSWVAKPIEPTPPSWMVQPSNAPTRTKPTKGIKPAKALLFAQFEMVFPRVLEMMYAGATLTSAIKELPGDYGSIDLGAFTRWLYKDSERHALYKEAKTIRTEAWTGKMMEHALGENLEDIDRSKFVVDTLKWLISRENRKDYGETKTLDVTGSISIVAALAQANARVEQVTTIDVELLDESEYKQLAAGDEQEDDE